MLVIRPRASTKQFLCIPIDTPNARREMGVPDSQPPVVVDCDIAEIERWVPFKLAPYKGS